MNTLSSQENLNAAIGHFNAGRYEAAQEACVGLSVAASPFVARLLGLCAERLGDPAQAAALLIEGLAAPGADVDLHRVLLTLGLQRLARMEIEPAAAIFQRAAALAPCHNSNKAVMACSEHC